MSVCLGFHSLASRLFASKQQVDVLTCDRTFHQLLLVEMLCFGPARCTRLGFAGVVGFGGKIKGAVPAITGRAAEGSVGDQEDLVDQRLVAYTFNKVPVQ